MKRKKVTISRFDYYLSLMWIRRWRVDIHSKNNPFDPFTHFDLWYAYHTYYMCGCGQSKIGFDCCC